MEGFNLFSPTIQTFENKKRNTVEVSFPFREQFRKFSNSEIFKNL